METTQQSCDACEQQASDVAEAICMRSVSSLLVLRSEPWLERDQMSWFKLITTSTNELIWSEMCVDDFCEGSSDAWNNRMNGGVVF